MSYSTQNYIEPGGERSVIGGELRIATGGKVTPNSGTQAGAIANLPTNLSDSANGAAIAAAVNANATAINAILAAMRGLGMIAT